MMENNFLPKRIKIFLLFDLLSMMFRCLLSFFDITASSSKVSSKLANFDMPDAIQWLLRVYCNVYIFVKTVSAASAFFPPTLFLPCPVGAEQLLRFILQPLTSILRPPFISQPFFLISEQIIYLATIILFLYWPNIFTNVKAIFSSLSPKSAKYLLSSPFSFLLSRSSGRRSLLHTSIVALLNRTDCNLTHLGGHDNYIIITTSHYDRHHVGQVDCTASLRAWFIDLWNSNLVNLLRQVRQLCLLDK